MVEPHDFGARDRAHISIDSFREVSRYTSPARPQRRRPLRENYAAHAGILVQQLTSALGPRKTLAEDSRLPLQGLRPGTLVEIETRPPDNGARVKAVKIPAKFEFPTQEILLLRTRRNENRTESAVVFVPDQAREFLQDCITEYGNDPVGATRPHIDRFEAVESITAARSESLFVGELDVNSTNHVWWELWSSGDRERAEQLARLAREQNIDVHADRLFFPDVTVVFVHATAKAVVDFVSRIPGAISEVRKAEGTIEPLIDQRTGGIDQHDWIDDFALRVKPAPEGANVVCALDTGVAAAHPLLTPGLRGTWAVDNAWGTDDHEEFGGHGTPLAGLILYGDLELHAQGTAEIALTHDIESMKLLPPNGFPPTKPPSYGVVTQAAVSLVEIERRAVLRAFCIASSTTEFPSSRPSTWSGALDQIASGAMQGDGVEGQPASQAPKRLVVVATGNTPGGMLADIALCQPIEDPSQSWNSLTIGGFTRKEQVPATHPPMTPAVPANNRSPYSRGSHQLPDDLTPMKPEVLFEAGNMVADASGFCGHHPATSLLSTGKDVATEPFVPFWATSAAAGVAGNFVGRLQAALPDLWPETHRALTVNSADWPQPIRRKLIGVGAHWKTGTKARKQEMLREVGYGVPDIDRAILSARNDLTLIAQAEIQPFALGADGRSGVFNEMHFYDLPWPRTALEQLENETVIMKVTLSYFIEPNLSGKAATRPDTYRSYGLRFAMKKRNETTAAFQARINAAQEHDGPGSEGEADYWLLGSKAVQAGSLHCDLWRGHAIDLAGHDAVAVYPVGGWWKSHTGQRRISDTGRYALVISISAAGQSIDLYSEVANRVAVSTTVA